MFKFVFYTIVRKTKLSGVGFVRLDPGREPDLSGSESDMYTHTVQARSKICPCVPPRTPVGFVNPPRKIRNIRVLTILTFCSHSEKRNDSIK